MATPNLHYLDVQLTPADGDTLDAILEPYAEAVMCFVGRKGLGVEESDTSEPTVRLREIEQEIIDSAPNDLTGDTTEDHGW